MALHAAGSFFGRVMEVVFPGPIFAGHVASVAKGVPIHIYLTAVRFMAVLANHPGLVHFALEKGSIDINLLQDLPVWIIESLVQQGRPVGIQQ
jgi:hypothetical protein